MRLPKITDLVREQARFTHYEDGKLWYQIIYTGEDPQTGYPRPEIFDFPVPVDDAESGRFEKSDKSLFFMRWIRKHIEMLRSALEERKET